MLKYTVSDRYSSSRRADTEKTLTNISRFSSNLSRSSPCSSSSCQAFYYSIVYSYHSTCQYMIVDYSNIILSQLRYSTYYLTLILYYTLIILNVPQHRVTYEYQYFISNHGQTNRKKTKPKPKSLYDHIFVSYYLPIKIAALRGHKKSFGRDFASLSVALSAVPALTLTHYLFYPLPLTCC